MGTELQVLSLPPLSFSVSMSLSLCVVVFLSFGVCFFSFLSYPLYLQCSGADLVFFGGEGGAHSSFLAAEKQTQTAIVLF